jgi:hypothetical protein
MILMNISIKKLNMIIRREKRNERFSVINNIPLEDKKLSAVALGIYVYIMSKPDNWNAHKNEIYKRFGEATINTSKNLIDSAFSELIKSGYIVLKTPIQRLDNGQIRFAGKEYVFHDEPQLQLDDNSRVTEISEAREIPKVEKPRKSEKVAYITNTDLLINTNNNIIITDLNNKQETDFKKSAPSPKKEKPKTYDYTFPLNFDDELKETFKLFLKYKIERKENYTGNTSVQILLNQISKYIDVYDVKLLNELILICMANNYKGIIFEKLQKMQEEKTKFLKNNQNILKDDKGNYADTQAGRELFITDIREGVKRRLEARRNGETDYLGF